jgi:YceI-like domain
MKGRPAHLILLIGSVLALCGLALAGWIAFRPSPAPLVLKSPKATASGQASVSPSGPLSSDEALASACLAPTTSGSTGVVSGTWVVADGGEVGYRVREQYAGVTLPHEAVARTGRVRGWARIIGDTSGQLLEKACFAVDVSSLHSIDTPPVPGMQVSGRDEALGQVIDYKRHPVARLTIERIPITAAGRLTAHLAVPGALEIGGVTRPVRFDTQIQVNGDAVSIAGSTVINRGDFLRFDLSNAPVGIDQHVTIELSIVMRHGSSGK